MRDVRQELRSGDDAGAVQEKAGVVQEELDKAVADGKVSPEAAGQLQPLVDDLRDAANALAEGS